MTDDPNAVPAPATDAFQTALNTAESNLKTLIQSATDYRAKMASISQQIDDVMAAVLSDRDTLAAKIADKLSQLRNLTI